MNEALLLRPADFARIPTWSACSGAPGRHRGGGRHHWGHAEALAFAALLADGVAVRFTGQDTERGTFSQRHLVLHDGGTGARYTPLQALPQARASFAVYNSPLSESGALGFEYGYSVQAPDALVLWEAQFGDFANAAQVIIDQFIIAARAKWRQQPWLVLLLPHGYDGQGPEHSSARLERYLQLAGDDNLRVANCHHARPSISISCAVRRHARPGPAPVGHDGPEKPAAPPACCLATRGVHRRRLPNCD